MARLGLGGIPVALAAQAHSTPIAARQAGALVRSFPVVDQAHLVVLAREGILIFQAIVENLPKSRLAVAAAWPLAVPVVALVDGLRLVARASLQVAVAVAAMGQVMPAGSALLGW